jgi:uncharacterized protein (TIRG00374 family)
MPPFTFKKDRAFFLKLVISFALLLFILLRLAPVREILAAIREAKIFWLICSFSLHALGILISAVRWQILIRAQGDSVPLGFLAKSYLVGTFFNNFLPTRFGGDIVRIWDGSRYSESLLKSSAIVVVERLTGVIVLLLFALTASLVRLEMAQQLPFVWGALLLGALGLAAVLLFFTPWSEKLLGWLPDKGALTKIKRKVLEFRRVVWVYRSQKKAFLQALFWAVLLQINVILHYWLAGKAFSLSIPFIDYFIFIPILLLILTIPISIGGLGPRELIYTRIFLFYGITEAVAVSFSLVADFAFTLIIGLIGAIVYITRK